MRILQATPLSGWAGDVHSNTLQVLDEINESHQINSINGECDKQIYHYIRL